jgi:uncharacterized protein YrrD
MALVQKPKGLAATIGVTFAATQVVSFFKQSVAAAVEAEQAQTRLARNPLTYEVAQLRHR